MTPTLLAALFATYAATQPAPTLTLAPAAIVGGNNTSGTIDLGAPAPAAVTFTLTSSAPGVASFVAPNLGSASAVSTLQVTVPAGQARASFQLRTFGVSAPATATITAAAGAARATASLTVNPASLQAITVQPATIMGGGTMTGTITLDGVTPTPGGLAVALSLEETGIFASGAPPAPPAASVPASVTIRPDGRTATFTITTTPTANDRTYAIRTNIGMADNSFVVVAAALDAVQVVPGRIVGGSSAAGTLSLTGPAPTPGLTVELTADNAAVTVPARVVVPAGATSAGFSVGTQRVSRATSATITASHAAPSSMTSTTTVTFRVTRTAAVNVVPLAVAAIQIGGATANNIGVFGGRSVDATIVLNGTAPTGGQAVTLASSSPQVLPLPATVTVPAGSDRVTVAITPVATAQVTPVSLGASVQPPQGITTTRPVSATDEATSALTVFPLPQLRGVTIAPSPVKGGSAVVVTLDVAVATGTFAVRPPATSAQIVVSRTDLLQLPTTVTVPGAQLQPQPITVRGSTRATTADTQVQVTVTLEGSRAATTVVVQR